MKRESEEELKIRILHFLWVYVLGVRTHSDCMMNRQRINVGTYIKCMTKDYNKRMIW